MANDPKRSDQSQIDDHLYEPPDDDNEYEDDDDFWLEQECGLMADGQCAMAGTEHCDFSCPNRDSEDFVGSAAWIAKHKARIR